MVAPADQICHFSQKLDSILVEVRHGCSLRTRHLELLDGHLGAGVVEDVIGRDEDACAGGDALIRNLRCYSSIHFYYRLRSESPQMLDFG